MILLKSFKSLIKVGIGIFKIMDLQKKIADTLDLQINADDILYCNIDKLGFYFKSSELFWYFKSKDPFPDREEVIAIWDIKYNFLVYLSDKDLNGYDKKLWLKIEFRWEYYEVIDILFNLKENRYLCVFHWKLWRFSTLKDFWFSNQTLIEFISKNFTGIQLREIHICLDVEEKENYLTRINEYIKNYVPKVFNKDTYNFSSWNLWRQIEIGLPDRKNNKEFFYKIYNKTLQARKMWIDKIYVDYCLSTEKNVFRYEIEFRQNIAKTIKLEDLKLLWPQLEDKKESHSGRYILNEWICRTLVSYFIDKQKFDFVFWKLNIENVKLKRSTNRATGSVGKKVNDLNLVSQLKSIRTQAKNIETITWISLKNNFDKLDEMIWESEDYKYYITVYKWIFRTIRNHYENNEVKDFDELTEIVKGATIYALNFLKTDYRTFFKVIRWGINRNADSVIEFLADNENSLVEMIYFYYFWRLREWILFDFLDVLREWNLPLFQTYFENDKKLRKQIIEKQKTINAIEEENVLNIDWYSTAIFNIFYK